MIKGVQRLDNEKDLNYNFDEFKKMFLKFIDNKDNPFHPLVWIQGNPEIGKNVYIGGFSEINANKASIKIGNGCDIASFVSINVADSHNLCIGLDKEVHRGSIELGKNVFVGSHSFIGRNTKVGHHSVIGAGSVVINVEIPPYSLAVGNPLKIKEGYFKNKLFKKEFIKK